MKHAALAAFAAALTLGSAGAAAAQTAMAEIRSLETGAAVPAQFNPTEIHVTQDVPWKKQKGSPQDDPALQLDTFEPRTLEVELRFDAGSADVREAFVAKLEQLAAVDPATKRPPLVQFTWGSFPPFRGAIEKLDVRYTLFLPDGTPVRATCNVKIKEATVLRVKRAKAFALDTCQMDAQCGAGRVCFDGACAPQP